MRQTFPAVAGMPPLDRCRVIGVVNVTPDSFSDGGVYADADAAVEHGLALLAEGADIVDVGGESTRPGAQRVTEHEEQRRVLPVVRRLVAAGATVSIDTMRASTAAAALDAGATMVNDVSGGRADEQLPRLVASVGCPYVVMHWRAHSTVMREYADYLDVVGDVVDELARRLQLLTDVGIDLDQIVLDPGLGFAKKPEHNWALLSRLDALLELGRPLLIGASRKSFLGALLGDGEKPRALDERDDATAAITALAAAAGAWAVRVHAVRASADAVRVVARLQQEQR